MGGETHRVDRHGLQPLARVTGYASVATDPLWLFDAPPLAIRRLLERTGLHLDDFDLLEVNEAFAAQVVANGATLGWDASRVNVHGGAIALGHPLGATGARLLVTLLYALRQHGGRRGLAALCHGGGGAGAERYPSTSSAASRSVAASPDTRIVVTIDSRHASRS